MYPSKRRRGDLSPMSAHHHHHQAFYSDARVHTPSLRRYDRSNNNNFGWVSSANDTNRSVRGPALAPTTRFDRPVFTASTQRPHSLYDSMDRQPRLQASKALYSCDSLDRGIDDWDLRRDSRGARFRSEHPPPGSSTPPPQLPGLSQLLHTKRKQPLSPDDEDNDSEEEEDASRLRGRVAHGFRQSTFTTANPPTRLAASDRLRRVASPETATTESSGSTPLSDTSMGIRDTLDAALALTDALPIHPFPSRPFPGALVRTDSISSVETLTPTGSRALPPYPCARTLAKSSRYLREIDRRNILQRIENGEKQAALAKEYQVSRAAICNLNKHRDVVLSRKDENPLAKHPKRPRPKGVPAKIKITSKPTDLATSAAFVCEFKSRSTVLLLTLLRSPETNATDFRRYADRILRLILEEALALVPVKNVHVAVSESVQIEGLQVEHPTCAVALEVTGGAHFLRVFHMLEPHQPTGSIRIRGEQLDAHVPPDLGGHNVFLFDLFTYSGETVCTALTLLVSRGVRENCVWLVSLCVAYEVAELIHTRFPQVKIITAQVDRSNLPLPSDNAPQASSSSGDRSTAVTPEITKPDIPTKVLMKRFLQAYEPRRATRPADANAKSETPQEQQVI